MYVHVFWHIFKAIKLTKCPSSEFHKQHSDDDDGNGDKEEAALENFDISYRSMLQRSDLTTL